MTRRRSVLLATVVSAAAALVVGSNAFAGGTAHGKLAATQVSHTTRAGHASSGLEPVPRSAEHGSDRHGSRGTARPAHPVSATSSSGPTLLPGSVGVEEAGRQVAVTRHIRYTGKPTVTFHYPGAEYVKVHFSRLLLRPGDYVTVSDKSGDESYRYHANPNLMRVPGDSPATGASRTGFWAMSVTGDTAVVRLHKALPIPGAGTLGVDIDKVAHGFTAAQRSAREHRKQIEQGGQPESVCGVDDARDAVCYRSTHPVEYRHSRPVARLLIGGEILCTAWRVTADNRMLTNHHCLDSQAAVSNTEVWFNYRCTVCGGFFSAPITRVPAGRLLRTNQTLDYTLFTLKDFGAVRRFGYLKLDPRVPRAGEEVYIPQHPEGEPTKLAIGSDQDPNSTCRIERAMVNGYGKDTDTSYLCDTEPGSSGSPVISRRTNKVIAIHHLGGCPNSGVRIDLIYAQIKSLL